MIVGEIAVGHHLARRRRGGGEDLVEPVHPAQEGRSGHRAHHLAPLGDPSPSPVGAAPLVGDLAILARDRHRRHGVNQAQEIGDPIKDGALNAAAEAPEEGCPQGLALDHPVAPEVFGPGDEPIGGHGDRAHRRYERQDRQFRLQEANSFGTSREAEHPGLVQDEHTMVGAVVDERCGLEVEARKLSADALEQRREVSRRRGAG